MSTAPAVVVGVSPPAELERRRSLFEGLGRAASVVFEGRDPRAWRGCDAAVLVGTPAVETMPAEALLVPAGPAPEASRAVPVDLSASETLDTTLRGRCLLDDRAGAVGHLDFEDGNVLASTGGKTLWMLERRPVGGLSRSALPLPELHQGGRLRDSLRPGSFASLLPLVDLLRRVSGWEPPPVRAAFVFDDPNLHWHSYGYVRFRDLAARASAHSYRVTFGLVPLDTWLIHPGVARCFRESAPLLSLAVHGNDHVKHELGRWTSAEASRRRLTQALRRVERFERRSGLPVARVMIPPHGVCSKPAMRALADCGFFSACFWIDPAHVADPVVAGLRPADDTAEGLPVIARQPFTESLESLALDAYLRRPLVLYGHHRDLAGDPDRLTELAGTLAQLGDVRWCGLGEVAVTNVSRRRAGGVLHLWLHARRVRIRIPDGVEELVVGDADPSELDVVVVSNCNGRELGRADPGLPLEVGNESEVEVRLERRQPNAATTPTGLRPWPVIRRTLVEGRDRLIPLLP